MNSYTTFYLFYQKYCPHNGKLPNNKCHPFGMGMHTPDKRDSTTCLYYLCKYGLGGSMQTKALHQSLIDNGELVRIYVVEDTGDTLVFNPPDGAPQSPLWVYNKSSLEWTFEDED